jgi:teichuronic acid biosynthesis glycosyltransferase TuaC
MNYTYLAPWKLFTTASINNIERKGVDILITAVSRLPEQAALQLLIVGEGPLEIPLRELVQQLNLNGMVHFMGKVARNAMHLYLGAANLFVLPSYSEGRPNVVLEAMSCARSVIATNINGTRELIRSGENGLLFEPGDAVTLSKHIESLLDDESRSSLLGQKARQTILDLGLTWEAHGAKLGRLYERLLANPAKA